MAFQTGTQVNAGLGRTDYTPFLQGALQGAAAQGRAGELIGQGLAGLGQQVGQGIEKYSEQKKKNAERDGRINATLGAIQANAKTLERYGRTEEAETLRATGANILRETDLDKRAAMSQGVLESFLQGQQIESGARQRQLGEQAALYSGLLEQSGGADVSLESGPMSPIAQQQGRAMYLDNLYKQSQIAKNLSQKAGTPGTVMTPAEVAAIPAGIDFKGTPMPDGNVFVTGVSRFAPTQPVPEPVNPFESKVVDQLVNLDSAAKAAPQQLENINNEIKLLKSGKVNVGFLGQMQQGLSKIRSVLGDKNAAESVTDTQILDSLLGGDLLNAIKSAGLTTKSFDTPAELENLRKALTGSTTLEAPVLEKIALLRKKNVEALVDDYNKKVKSGAYKRMYSVMGQTPAEIKLGVSADGASAGKSDNYVVGQTYRDANGNEAVYQGNGVFK